MNKSKLIKTILNTCLFSEYLPTNFNTRQLEMSILSINAKNHTPPVQFTMDRFNGDNSRRFVFVPDIVPFIGAVRSINSNNLIDQMIKNNNDDIHSFSKIVKNDAIRKFASDYIIRESLSSLTNNEPTDEEFFDNLKIKIEKSIGCECVLHLDISNCFGSFYTHNIVAILDGYEWGLIQFEKEEDKEERFKLLEDIDKNVRLLNGKRTHGLLVGPRLSFIIVECLLTRIDKDLEEKLGGIDFVRYMDDYDIFIKNKEDISRVINIFSMVLKEYGFVLNNLKTKEEYFPFYTYIDYKSLVEENNNEVAKLYGRFGQIEKNGIQNGAILYFCENVLHTKCDNLSLSISFSILKNYSRATISACENIRCMLSKNNNNKFVELLFDMLKEFVYKGFDLESIWVLYSLLKINPSFVIDKGCLYKMNELALIVYFYESRYCKKSVIKELAPQKGWLLNYELFYSDVIGETEFIANLKIKNANEYKELKKNGIHFYDCEIDNIKT